MKIKEKEEKNIWDSIDDVLPIIDKMKKKQWSWSKNFECKYINLRIDMRNGSCLIKNRHGDRIDPKDLAYQHPTKKIDGSQRKKKQ